MKIELLNIWLAIEVSYIRRINIRINIWDFTNDRIKPIMRLEFSNNVDAMSLAKVKFKINITEIEVITNNIIEKAFI